MRREISLSELRHAPRVPVNLTARYSSGTILIQGHALNLSEHGMYFTMSEPAPLFDADTESISVEIDLLGRPIRARGEVCWVDGAHAGVGIRFTDMEPADHTRLAALVGVESLEI